MTEGRQLEGTTGLERDSRNIASLRAQVGSASIRMRVEVTPRGLLALTGLLYTVVVATLLGSGLWTALMARHPSSTVAPFSMLVPVVGVLTSWLAFGEVIDRVELIAGLAVVAGVLYASRPGRRPAVDETVPAAVEAGTAAR